MIWSRIRPAITRLCRSLCFLFAFILLSIGNGGSGCDHAALGRDARLGLNALDNFCACMRELGRLKHCVQIGPAAGVTERRERDDNHRDNDRDRNIAMPSCGIEAATASSATANVAERSIVLEL